MSSSSISSHGNIQTTNTPLSDHCETQYSRKEEKVPGKESVFGGDECIIRTSDEVRPVLKSNEYSWNKNLKILQPTRTSNKMTLHSTHYTTLYNYTTHSGETRGQNILIRDTFSILITSKTFVRQWL